MTLCSSGLNAADQAPWAPRSGARRAARDAKPRETWDSETSFAKLQFAYGRCGERTCFRRARPWERERERDSSLGPSRRVACSFSPSSLDLPARMSDDRQSWSPLWRDTSCQAFSYHAPSWSRRTPGPGVSLWERYMTDTCGITIIKFGRS